MKVSPSLSTPSWHCGLSTVTFKLFPAAKIPDGKRLAQRNTLMTVLGKDIVIKKNKELEIRNDGCRSSYSLFLNSLFLIRYP